MAGFPLTKHPWCGIDMHLLQVKCLNFSISHIAYPPYTFTCKALLELNCKLTVPCEFVFSCLCMLNDHMLEQHGTLAVDFYNPLSPLPLLWHFVIDKQNEREGMEETFAASSSSESDDSEDEGYYVK
jgi:hypothetical protein